MFKKPNLLQIYGEAVQEEILERLHLEKKRKRQVWLRFANYLVWLFVVLVLLILISLAFLYPVANEGYEAMLSAKNEMEIVRQSLKDGNTAAVKDNLTEASNNLTTAIRDVKKIKYSPVGWLPIIGTRLNDTDKLLGATKLTVDSASIAWVEGGSLFRLLPGSKSLSFSKMKIEEKKKVLEEVAAGQVFLPELKNNITTAEGLLNSINDKDFFADFGININQYQEFLAKTEKLITEAEPIALLLPKLAGHNASARYLFILQNKDELRPTGGFIGTYGIGIVSEGEIQRLDTSDVYNLDIPVKDKFKQEPPMPIKKYLGQKNWFFRDANWNPDWPTTSEKLIWFFREENKVHPTPEKTQNFDFVIALTPQTIVDLIALTGPVTLRGQTYTKDNFIELLQRNTEVDFEKIGFKYDSRKLIVGEITKELENRIINNLDKLWQPVIKILRDNLTSKDILVWANNVTASNYLLANNWSGALQETGGDYLYYVDANLHALKTDAVINRKLAYSLKENANDITSIATMSYAHNGNPDWKTDVYKSYVRLYVPQGSELIKITGGASEPEIGVENGKTYFGVYFTLEPGKIGGLSFEYKLPASLYSKIKKDGYDLILQKQPGVKSELFVNLDFLKTIKKYEPVGLHSSYSGSQVEWKDSLDQDKEYKIEL